MIIILENLDRFYNFFTVVSRKNRFTHILQKFPPHLNNVLTLPSENENIKFHTFIMHSLNTVSYTHLTLPTIYSV